MRHTANYMTSTNLSLPSSRAAARTHDSGPRELVLARRNQVVSCDGLSRGATVTVLEGRAWVTQTDDPEDYVIRAGAEALRLDRRGRLVIQALRAPCRVLVDGVR